ncbi:HD-GYP domain, c-di-GMP phosphodiesterase class II (or its inactivated variant) [Gracilibacillus orientalis]|uniref:HD-GYP domain, c-di-GMP phosphodiesterase class II (Or its inactivated variant) n=1 Tax=Gracilibacillus orientalis TaxID=334253 RepID=A0A1I4K8C7_9BACI|nr:HD-GYP domain, c-di-GMP phosphodiesterase class II (or its inactivated variant) [Gracilibacillus orientalis]
MQVHPQQLISGCITTKQVFGKTRHPIIDKNTVINEEHIQVLKHFNIDSVEVSEKLASGSHFIPEKVTTPEHFSRKNVQRKSRDSFENLYLNAVLGYKAMFQKWQGGSPIDIYQVQKMMMPLFDYVKDISLDLFLLHKFASKQDYFYHHGVSIALLSAHLAKKLGYEKEWVQVGIAAILADSGMAKLNENWLMKESRLTIAEYEEIKKHPTLSYRMVEDIPYVTQDMKLSILQHHERMDGSGYPIGVRAEKIHPFAKIIAVSDTYHAMTSERVYRRKQSPFKVVEEMLKLKYQKFDYPVLQKFIDTLMNYTIGTRVMLSTGKEAYIIFVDYNQPTRPMVRVMDSGEIIKLNEKKAIFIENIITE